MQKQVALLFRLSDSLIKEEILFWFLYFYDNLISETCRCHIEGFLCRTVAFLGGLKRFGWYWLFATLRLILLHKNVEDNSYAQKESSEKVLELLLQGWPWLHVVLIRLFSVEFLSALRENAIQTCCRRMNASFLIDSFVCVREMSFTVAVTGRNKGEVVLCCTELFSDSGSSRHQQQ